MGASNRSCSWDIMAVTFITLCDIWMNKLVLNYTVFISTTNMRWRSTHATIHLFVPPLMLFGPRTGQKVKFLCPVSLISLTRYAQHHCVCSVEWIFSTRKRVSLSRNNLGCLINEDVLSVTEYFQELINYPASVEKGKKQQKRKNGSTYWFALLTE